MQADEGQTGTFRISDPRRARGRPGRPPLSQGSVKLLRLVQWEGTSAGSVGTAAVQLLHRQCWPPLLRCAVMTLILLASGVIITVHDLTSPPWGAPPLSLFSKLQQPRCAPAGLDGIDLRALCAADDVLRARGGVRDSQWARHARELLAAGPRGALRQRARLEPLLLVLPLVCKGEEEGGEGVGA